MSLKLEELVGKSITEAQFDEAAGKKDACYRKVKARYDVWPSAYASGALVKCRKVGAKNWGNKSKKESVNENTERAVKDMINRRVVKKGQNNKDRVRAIGQWLDDHSHEVSATYNDNWIRRIKMGRGGQVQDWWGDTMTMIKNRLGESLNESGMELNKLRDAIKMFQKKIEKQGRVTNARDEEHLSNLIKLYNQMGGKGIKESLSEDVSPKGWNMSKKYIKFIEREVKNLKKYHMQQNEEDFLEVANYIELQLKQMKKDLNESVNERTDSQAKKNLMRALKNSKVANVFSYDNDQIAIEMTNGDDYIVGNIQSYNPNESVNEDLYYGYYKDKKVKVNAKSDKDAKKQIISKLKIPKGDLNRASMINHTKNNPVAEGKANIYGIEYRKVGQSGAKFQKSSLTMSSSQGRKMHKKMTMAIIQKAEKLRKQDNWADYRITVNGAPYIGWGGKAITGYPPPKLNEAPGKNHKDQYVGQARVKVEPGTYKGQKVNFHDVSMYRDHKKPYHYYLSIKLAHSNKVDMVVDTGTHIQSKAGKWAQGFMKRRMGGTGNERFS